MAQLSSSIKLHANACPFIDFEYIQI